MFILLQRALLISAFAAAAPLHFPAAQALDYPTRQITIMPLLAPGTGLDVTVRLYAEQLSQAFGKPVVVENKPGSAGLIGIAALKAAPPDGQDQLVRRRRCAAPVARVHEAALRLRRSAQCCWLFRQRPGRSWTSCTPR
jgi:hypothetical protein